MRLLPRRRARAASPEPAPDASAPCIGGPAAADNGRAPHAAPSARRRTRGRSPEAAAAALAGAPCIGGPGAEQEAGRPEEGLTPDAPIGLSSAPREKRKKALPVVRCWPAQPGRAAGWPVFMCVESAAQLWRPGCLYPCSGRF